MTSSELLIDTMSTFGDAEPTNIMIVWLNEKREIQVAGNCGAIQMIGMCEYVKQGTIEEMLKR